MIFCLIIACSWSIFKIFDDRRLIIGDSFFFLLKSNFKKITCVLRNNTTICKVFYFFEQKSSTRSVCYYVTRSVVSLSLVRRLHSSVEGNKRERERERNLRIRRNKSSGVLLWRKIYIFFLRLSGIQTQIVRRKSSSITLKTAIQIAEQRISLFNVPSTNVTHVSRWQRFTSISFNFILFQFLLFSSSPPPLPPAPSSSSPPLLPFFLFLSDFDQGWKDYICWSRDALLSHQQFIADDNISWANNKNTGVETS